MKKTKINTNLLRKFSLKDKILKENCTIAEAAISFDMLALNLNVFPVVYVNFEGVTIYGNVS
jgi:hypothetical protein